MTSQPLLAGAGQRGPWRLRLALAACTLAAVMVCLQLLLETRSPAGPSQLLTRCTRDGCAEVGGDRRRTSQLQLASHSAHTSHSAQGRATTPDLGILGRVGKVGSMSMAPARREAYQMPDVGLLGRVESIGHAKTPSLKSWNIGHSFEGSGLGPKWQNGRTAVIGHHAHDPKIIEDASDVIKHGSSYEHDRYYYDDDHDNNGRLLEGGNEDAPSWWQKGKASQRRPYVTWGSRYAGELEKDEHKDDTRLVNAGVNVESRRDFFRGMPLPWFVYLASIPACVRTSA